MPNLKIANTFNPLGAEFWYIWPIGGKFGTSEAILIRPSKNNFPLINEQAKITL